MELPGARRPPELIVVLGRKPFPPIVPPEATVNPDEDAIDPFTKTLAPLPTVVAPVYVLSPERIMYPPAPVFVKPRGPAPENTPLKFAILPF